jgi:hypothetical protein
LHMALSSEHPVETLATPDDRCQLQGETSHKNRSCQVNIHVFAVLILMEF